MPTQENWFRRKSIDALALVCSVVAVVVSFTTWKQTTDNDDVSVSLDMCWSFYQGAELEQERLAVRMFSSPDELTPQQSRNIGEFFNVLNITAIAWRNDRLDQEVAFECFAPEYENYCQFVVSLGRAPRTKWHSLNDAITDVTFWKGNVPTICDRASKLLTS